MLQHGLTDYQKLQAVVLQMMPQQQQLPQQQAPPTGAVAVSSPAPIPLPTPQNSSDKGKVGVVMCVSLVGVVMCVGQGVVKHENTCHHLGM